MTERELLKAYEAWEGDIILNGDWGPDGMHPYPRLTESQYDEMMRLQAERNLLLYGNTMGNLAQKEEA